MINHITNKVLAAAIRKQYTFKQEKDITWRRSFKIFQNNVWFYSGVSSKAECRRRIEWTVEYRTRQLQQQIREIRKLGFKVTLRNII